MNPLYSRLETKTVVSIIRRYGQKCLVLSATDTGYNPSGVPTSGKESLCVVCNVKNQTLLDGENPVKLERGDVKILLISRVKPEKGGSIYANDRYYRIFFVEEVNPAGLAVLYKAYATDKDQAKLQLYPVDLNRQVEIYQRQIRGDRPSDTMQSITSLLKIADVNMSMTTIKPTKPVQLLNINANVSHVFYFRFADFTTEIDITSHILKCEDEYYRIEQVDNDGEYDQAITLYCRKTGDDLEGRS